MALCQGLPTDQNILDWQKWRSHKTIRLFSKPIFAKEGENGPPSTNQGLYYIAIAI